MKARRSLYALLVLLLFLLRPAAPAHAQIGGIPKEIARQALEQLKSLLYKQIGEAIGAGSPLLLDQHFAFPDASASVTDFHPKLLTPTAADLSKPLPPGDFVIGVTGYCSQYSIHAPGGGLGYKLAREQGPAAPAISALLVRGTAQNISPSTLNAEAWRIEAGMPLNQWPDQDQSLIHQLIPDHEKDLQGDFIQQLRNIYDQHTSIRFMGRRFRNPILPPFDALLTQMGAPGKAVIQLEGARQILSDRTISAERLPDMLYQPTGDGQPRVLPPSDDPSPSPWAEIQPGVFARLTIIDGNMGRNRFEFRITPAAFQPVSASTAAIPHFSNAASFTSVALPGGLSLGTLYAAPSLASILEGAGPVVARFVVVGGEVVFVAAEGAAAIVSAPVVLTGAGVVLIGYSMYQPAQALGLLPIIMQNQAKPPDSRDKDGEKHGEKLGDLTPTEVEEIQHVVDEVERPLDVIGSAAEGNRRPGSDIDYLTNQNYLPGFREHESELPSIDPTHGIVPGAHNPYMGPSIRFEPGVPPVFVPAAKH